MIFLKIIVVILKKIFIIDCYIDVSCGEKIVVILLVDCLFI